MTTRYANIDRDTPLLLPPNLRDWVPEDHLAHFVIDAMEHLDVSAARGGAGDVEGEVFPAGMLLGLLIYSYATGKFSSRRIERASYENVAVRLLCADTHPGSELLCTFRRRNEGLLASCFAQLLELAAGCGVRKVGRIRVAIDGMRILANAGKSSAAIYEHAAQTMRPVELEVAQLLRQAEEADAAGQTDGLTLPVEMRNRPERVAQLARARGEMEARAAARLQAEQTGKLPAREGDVTVGKKLWARPPESPEAAPGGAEQQFSFTDLEKRLIKAGSAEHV